MNLISQLDDYCQQHDGDKELPGDFRTGPFGVFESKSSKATAFGAKATAPDTAKSNIPEAVDSTALDSDMSSHDGFANLDTDLFSYAGAEPLISIPEDPPSNESSIEEIANELQHDSVDQYDGLNTEIVQALSRNGLWQVDDPFSFMSDFGISMDMMGEDFMLLDSFDAASSVFAMAGNPGIFGSSESAQKTATPFVREQSDWSHLLTEAPALLRCYQVDNAAPEPAKQSFWKSFVLPSAMRTFAELSVFGKASIVSSSIFYSVLANSAFSMQQSNGPPIDPHWYKIGKSAEDAALYYLQNALQQDADEIDCQDLLSAILSVALNSVSQFLSRVKSYLVYKADE